jgi:hypothetical protein
MPTYAILCRSCKTAEIGSYTTAKALTPEEMLQNDLSGHCQQCALPIENQARRRKEERAAAAQSELRALSKEQKKARREAKKTRDNSAPRPLLKLKESK